MHSFFYLLTLLASLVAPLAAPAAAMAVEPAKAECAEMAGHEMPASDHGVGEACCIAVPPAIGPSLTVVDGSTAIEHLSFVALNQPFRLGAGPKAEDPPPRMA